MPDAALLLSEGQRKELPRALKKLLDQVCRHVPLNGALVLASVLGIFAVVVSTTYQGVHDRPATPK